MHLGFCLCENYWFVAMSGAASKSYCWADIKEFRVCCLSLFIDEKRKVDKSSLLKVNWSVLEPKLMTYKQRLMFMLYSRGVPFGNRTYQTCKTVLLAACHISMILLQRIQSSYICKALGIWYDHANFVFQMTACHSTDGDMVGNKPFSY